MLEYKVDNTKQSIFGLIDRTSNCELKGLPEGKPNSLLISYITTQDMEDRWRFSMKYVRATYQLT